MAMHRFLGVVLALAALAACEETPPLGPPAPPRPIYAPPPPPPPPQDSFREADFGWSTAAGAGKLIGALAYKGNGGRYTCQSVILAPETPWSRARMEVLYLSSTSADVPADEAKARTPPEHGAQYAKYVRQAACDATGRFSFAGLPDGAWYAITVATPVGGGAKMAIMRRLETHGDTVRLVLR
jgi:hypothetical protein